MAEIQVAGGRAQGVRLKDGTEIRATEVQLGGTEIDLGRILTSYPGSC